MFRTSLPRRDSACIDSPHSATRSTLGGASGLKLRPGRRSMVSPSRFSVGIHLMIWLSVTIRTATLSTSGGLEASTCARAVRELPARVPISAVTKPAPPAQSKPRRDIDKVRGSQLHVPMNMSKSSRLLTWRQVSAGRTRPCARRVLGETPARKDCRFIECAMPADGIPAAHPPRTETSAHPVSKSSSKEDYPISRPAESRVLAGARHKQFGQNECPNVRVGSFAIGAEPVGSSGMSAMPPKAEVNSEHQSSGLGRVFLTRTGIQFVRKRYSQR